MAEPLLDGNKIVVTTKICARMTFVMDSSARAGKKDMNIINIFLICFFAAELPLLLLVDATIFRRELATEKHRSYVGMYEPTLKPQPLQ